MNPKLLTHIYDLSGLTQDKLHVIFNFAGEDKENPVAKEMIIRDAKLQRNAEVQMLLGDYYRKVGRYEDAVKVYRNIRLNGLADDRSIDDAVRHTKQISASRQAVATVRVNPQKSANGKVEN